MEKLVSVIIPVFNAEHYIRECLDSVLGQSYKNLEIILTDDGSTDSTKDLLSEYTFLDSRIKIIHQSNKGPAAARNSSLTEARGEYIVFFDADDVMFRDKISQQVGWLEKNKKYDFVFSDFIFHINGTEK